MSLMRLVLAVAACAASCAACGQRGEDEGPGGTQGGPPPLHCLWVYGAIDPSPPCASSDRVEASDSEALVRALAAACAGDEVVLTGERYEGTFVLRAGVTLRGQGATLVGELTRRPALATICLEGGVGGEEPVAPTVIEGVTVVNEGVGVLAAGGRVVMRDVQVEVSRGVGVVVDGVESMEMGSVVIRGPVNRENLLVLGSTLDPQETAIAGLLMARSGASLGSVEVEGFAGFGAVFFDSAVDWQGGQVRGVVGTSVLVEGSQVSLGSVQISEGLRGVQANFSIVSSGLLISSGALVRSEDLSIEGMDGLGILQDGAVSAHAGLRISGTTDPGVWVQNVLTGPGGVEIPGQVDAATPALSLAGATITGSRGAGLLVQNATGVALVDAVIEGTQLRLQPSQTFDFIDVGDGIQLSGVSRAVALRRVALRDNGRVGLVVDGSPGDEGSEALFDFEAVTISGDPESSFGLIAQNLEAFDAEGISVEPALLAERDAQAALDGVTLDLTRRFSSFAGVGAVAEGGLVGSAGIVVQGGQLNTGVVVDGEGQLEVER